MPSAPQARKLGVFEVKVFEGFLQQRRISSWETSVNLRRPRTLALENRRDIVLNLPENSQRVKRVVISLSGFLQGPSGSKGTECVSNPDE